ncbi:MAG: DUF4870 domain-containing protein [Pyrinomonadaceae bacterium]|nr:DUF4870 domain-containing protein [Acidobacteriota bacterium]MBP7473652.1 DUF4870 domain-containing protein [Pyrinomonadaceae bacterium]MBP9108176.1 DUF4870 domain-containing protein [Pyrinomonadaceae bacterium]
MENSGKSSLGLDANVVAGLCYVANLVCYLGIVLAIITLVTDKVNKLARFHAAQSLLLIAANLIVLLPGYFIAFALMAMNSSVTTILGGLIMLVVALVGLALFVFLVISAIKAFQGQIYKVPVVGNFADKFSA